MSTAQDEQVGAKNPVIAWFRGRHWPDGHRISVLDDRWATVWVAVMTAMAAAIVARAGAYGVLGGAGGWPTVAVAVAVGVGVWLWARRRLARVFGDGRRPRLPDGRWVHSCSDRGAMVGYFVSGLMPMLAVYAAADAIAPELEDRPSGWILVSALVGAAAIVAVAVRLRAVEAQRNSGTRAIVG